MNIKPSDNYLIPLGLIAFMVCMFAALSFAHDSPYLIALCAIVFYPCAIKLHYMLEHDLQEWRKYNDRS